MAAPLVFEQDWSGWAVHANDTDIDGEWINLIEWDNADDPYTESSAIVALIEAGVEDPTDIADVINLLKQEGVI